MIQSTLAPLKCQIFNTQTNRHGQYLIIPFTKLLLFQLNNKPFNPILNIYQTYKVKIVNIVQSKWVTSKIIKVQCILRMRVRLRGLPVRAGQKAILMQMEPSEKIIWCFPKSLSVRITFVKKYRTKWRRMVQISSNLRKVFRMVESCQNRKKSC